MPRVLKSSCAFRLEDDYLRPVHMEKSCPEWKGHLPTRATQSEPPFHTFPYKTRRTVYMHKKQKITRLVEWPGSIFSDARVAFLVGPTFLHINTLAHPALGQLSEGETIRACASAVRSGNGVNFFSHIKRSLKLTRLGGWPFFSRRTSFLHLNGT